MQKDRRHPDWLRVPHAGGQKHNEMKRRLRASQLHTICEEAKCPNIAECFGRGTAAFLILGDTCTRGCKYCNVKHGIPQDLDESEPDEIAQSVKALNLSYAVITSVTRDDLLDGGAHVFYNTIRAVKLENPHCKVEVLIPDFNGNRNALQTVLSAVPDVLNHNIEVVKALFPTMRPEGTYETSLALLNTSKMLNSLIPTKSGFMVGFGETDDQIMQLMDDLREAQVDLLTIGQYLQPSMKHFPVEKYYTPNEFEHLKQQAYQRGFKHVESGPLVRSSYHADQSLLV